MDKKQASPKLSQAELPPTQEEQAPANPPSRKRQLDSDDDAEPRTKRARATRATRPTSEPARLTRQNLARFNKMGKKKTSGPSDDSGSTKTTSTTSSGFAIKARNNGILEPAYSKPPMNLEDLRRRQAKSRATASPPESAYNDYVDRVEGAGNEATMVVQTSELLKKYPKGYRQAYNRAFTNLPGDIGFNNGLSAPQPDFVEGLEAEEYRPIPADDHIPGAALYRDDPRSITLPQIAGEWKGPAGDMREARMQSAYDGAAMVHARNQALAYMGKADPAGYAEITTFTTDGANLNLFAHYATETEDGTLEYHQYPISSMNLTGTYQGHKDGRKSLRNAQDYAKTQSEELRDQLKEHWQQQRDNLQTIAAPLPPPNYGPPIPTDACDATALGEAHEDDYGVVEHQPVHQPTPPASSKHKSSKTHSHHSHHSHSTPHSSKAPSSTHGSTASSGQKRKASSSQESSSRHKYKSYWKKDAMSGRYYHKHSDGTVSWLDEEEEDERD
ncbi:hypothetical protein N0V84_000559 [Fusarium piperis]|uniref:DUF7924 domain-containing protein n=1 Tax=Fusarium piperis TaxID=1435070 RepID=A0A9W9BUP2_9HYPO|nr:hypothetical protein N0V84_000559 [Fusarium piperis]